jgi:hypothetical protein
MANISYVKHKDIDKEKWNACIDSAPNGLIYAYSFYLDIMSENWDALIMNDYEAVMPLTWNKKFGILYLHQPAFTQQLGIFGNVDFNNTLTEQFLQKAVEIFSFAEINLNYANEYHKTAARKCNLILSLHQPFDVIRKSFRKDLITKAKNNQLLYEASDNIEEAIQSFKNNYSDKLSHLSEKNYEDLLQLCILLKSKDQILIRKAILPNGNPLTISIFFKDNKRIYYILSATLPGARVYDANAFLLHELIKEFSGQNLILDFEGSDIPSIHFFFSKFNPVEQPYFFVRINKLKLWGKWIKKVYDIYKYTSSKG